MLLLLLGHIWIDPTLFLFKLHNELKLRFQCCLVTNYWCSLNRFLLLLLLVVSSLVSVSIELLLRWLSILHVVNHLLLVQEWIHLIKLAHLVYLTHLVRILLLLLLVH